MRKDLNDVKINLNNVKTRPGKAAKAPPRPYHHGDLRLALILAGESLLAERGVEGFSLREAARRAGFSPGAPAHHFGDTRGLLTAIAALGFAGLREALAVADAAASGRPARLKAQGIAYVRFALARPARFDLMWRKNLLDVEDEAFARESAAAFRLLHNAVQGRKAGGTETPEKDDIQPMAAAAWSLVHGFAALAREGNFNPDAPGLLEGVLDCLFDGMPADLAQTADVSRQ